MRRASALVSACLTLTALPLLPVVAHAATTPPEAATALQQYAANGGVGLTWSPPASAATTITGYHVYRGPDLVTDVPSGSSPLTALDAAPAPGTSADYTVVAYGDGGDSPATPALHATRPASDAVAGAGSAVVAEGIGNPAFVDAARPGDAVALVGSALQGSNGGGVAVTAGLPVVPGPGTYPVGAAPTGDQRPMSLALPSFSCSDLVGTLTVREAAFDASLTPLTYAAELTGTCAGYAVTASLRLHTDVPYVAVTVAPRPVAPQTDPGVALSTPVTLTNKSLSPLTVGAGQLSGADAAEYAVTPGTCTTDVPAGGSCDLSLSFTPTALGARPAQLDVPLGTLDDHRTIPLAGIGGHLPGAVSAVRVTPGYGRNLVSWQPPADLGSPSPISYHVYSGANGVYTSQYATTTTPSYLDTGVVPGARTGYKVVAVNPAGEGAATDFGSYPDATSAVLEVSQGPGGVPGLFQVPITSGVERRIPFLADGTPRVTPTVSPDGTQVVYAQSTSASPTAPTDLWVVSATGLGTPRRLTSLPGAEGEPAWSPDGRSVAFTYDTGTAVSVQTVPATGGTPALRAAGFEHPSWLADSTRIVADDAQNEGLAVLDAAGHAAPIAGSDAGYSPAVSPDGTRVAYTLDDTVTHLAVLPLTGGTPQVLSDTADWDSLAWSPDGHWVYGERYVGSNAPQLTRVGWNPGGYSQPNPLGEAGVADISPVVLQDKVHLTAAPRVTGSTATLTWAGGTVSATCSLDGAAPVTCASPWTRMGLTAGAHRLVVTTTPSVDGSVAALQWTVDTAAPALRLTAPTANAAGLAGSAGIAYTATDALAGVASYDVRYRRATSGTTYGAYASPAGWLGTTATSRTVAASPGYEYCFSVRARDRVGNVSPWTADRCVDVAVDDSSLTASSGWTRGRAAGFYRGTYSSATSTAAALSLRSVQTRRITLVVTRCAKCGQVGVYVAGTRVAVVDTRAATTAHQVKVAVLLPAVRTGAFVLQPLQAGRLVQVDGVAFGRA